MYVCHLIIYFFDDIRRDYIFLPSLNISLFLLQSQSQYSLFSLGMFIYTYKRQDIIQIALNKNKRILRTEIFIDLIWNLVLLDIIYRYNFIFVWLMVQSTARHAIHLQFDISATAFEIRAVKSAKCIVWCAVDCTYIGIIKNY
jgi:hypothetical protein